MPKRKPIDDPTLAKGDKFSAVLTETFDDGRPWPRVRPVPGGLLDPAMRVEFPKAIRSHYPIGTRFRVNLTVAQKRWSGGAKKGTSKGEFYLVAEKKSIVPLSAAQQVAIPKGGLERPTLEELHTLAKEAARQSLPVSATQTQRRARSEVIGRYARARAAGTCEACGDAAPFTHRNGQPYLEVHHIVPVGEGGADAPDNVAAICPNCHGRVTQGDDRKKYNEHILLRVRTKDSGRP